MGLREIEKVTVFCLANENTDISYEVNRALGEIRVYVPYDFMDFLALNSVEEKYKEFCKLVRQYVVPGLEENSTLSSSVVKGYIEESLDEIVKQNYEGIFLVGKTPKKSPSRKKIAILNGNKTEWMVMHNCIDEFWRIEIIAFYQSLLRKLMRFYFIPLFAGQ
ncbi:hypothetical protein ACPCHR_10820 [Bacillus bombysepticus]|uniref:hypothetical protein n=1 Tax=Bacillus cereus TaxID=1396 RepID=UPI00387EFE16